MKNLKSTKRDKKIKVIFLAGVSIVALILSFLLFQEEENNESVVGTKLGQYAPDFETEYLNGTKFHLYELRGKPVILNFWASWCPPCVREMPTLDGFYLEHKDEILVIGINLGEKDQTIERFLKRVDVSFPIVKDKDHSIEKSYNLIIRPTTYFINEKGIIVDKRLGELKKEEIEERGKKLLK